MIGSVEDMVFDEVVFIIVACASLRNAMRPMRFGIHRLGKKQFGNIWT